MRGEKSSPFCKLYILAGFRFKICHPNSVNNTVISSYETQTADALKEKALGVYCRVTQVKVCREI